MQTALALLGFAGLIIMMIMLLWDKFSPLTAFIFVSSCLGLILLGLQSLTYFGIDLGIGAALGTKSGTFGLKELSDFIKQGVSSVAATAALFIFSIMFFTILSSAGLFAKIIKALIRKNNGNVYGLMIITVIIAVIAHLDGSGASSFLIAIPALLPIYKQMNVRTTTLMLLLTASLGVMNLLPWGGPTLRVATILEKDATELYFQLMPMQIVGLILALALAVYMGFVESKRLRTLGFQNMQNNDFHGDFVEENLELSRDNNFILNLGLLVAILILLFFSGMPSYFPFMLGSMIALLINYPNLKTQDEVIKKSASSAMMMATTILAAGVLIGVFDKSGIMKLMAAFVLELMPQSFGAYLVIIIGLLAAPMALIFCTDSYFFGLLPIVATIGEAFGVSALSLGIAMVVCRNCAAFISPVVPATLLGCGLSGVSIRSHIKTSFFWVWGISIICLVSGIVLGIIKI